MAALVGDALPALEYALALQTERGGGPLFVMGRSMGTQPALEVAARRRRPRARADHRERRGKRAPLDRALRPRGRAGRRRVHRGARGEGPLDPHPFAARSTARRTTSPRSRLAAELYNQLENERREFVAIEGAGHNDILWIGRSEYFAAIRAFVDSLL